VPATSAPITRIQFIFDGVVTTIGIDAVVAVLEPGVDPIDGIEGGGGTLRGGGGTELVGGEADTIVCSCGSRR